MLEIMKALKRMTSTKHNVFYNLLIFHSAFYLKAKKT